MRRNQQRSTAEQLFTTSMLPSPPRRPLSPSQISVRYPTRPSVASSPQPRHGSGVRFPVLSQHVRSLTLVLPLPGAPIVRCSEVDDPDLFKASLCGLGATGMMVEIEIEVEPAFRLRETKAGAPVDEVLDRLGRYQGECRACPGMVVSRRKGNGDRTSESDLRREFISANTC